MSLGIFIVPIVIVIALVIYMIAFNLLMYFTKKSSKLEASIKDDEFIASAIISPIVLTLSLIVIVIFSNGKLENYGFLFPDIFQFVNTLEIGFVLAVIVVGAMHVIYRLYNFPAENIKSRKQILNTIVLIVILASIVEEVIFRGLVQRTIDLNVLINIQILGLNITMGILVGALLFSLVHFSLISKKPKTQVMLIMLSAFILGIAGGYYYNITNSLLAPIIIHFEFNLISLIASIFE